MERDEQDERDEREGQGEQAGDPHLKLVRIAVLENEYESQMLSEFLQENGIPHYIQSYYDAAYGTLFQSQMGWGEVQAEPTYQEEILEVLEQLRKPFDGPFEKQPPEA